MSSRVCIGPSLLVAFALSAAEPGSVRGYHRFPALHRDTVVFTSEGDLWRVSVHGGGAERLTSHPGMEAHATISRDGRWVAFSAQYEGPTEVYVMPLDGGLPRRLTFNHSNARVVGWTPEGAVLYATDRYSTLPNTQLVAVDRDSLVGRVLPLAQASEGVFDPRTQTLFFTRLPKQSSSTKRYRGGWVQNLWRFREGEGEAVPLTTDFAGTSRNPMWWRGRVYFVSDRDGVMNVWSLSSDGGDLRQHTKHRDWDVKSASLHRGRIVYQHGADLRLLDLRANADRPIEIRLASDFDQQRERWVDRPLDYLTAAHLSPKGDRVVLTARGQVFVAPVKQGRLVEVPRRTLVRYRDATFLPNGEALVALSDATGELEFWKLAANGLQPPVQLTTNAAVYRFAGVPSPDGQWLAWSDKDHGFWVHDLADGVSKRVVESSEDPITDFAWSPDSAWLAYVETATNTYRQIKLYQVRDGTRAPATTERIDSYSPAWSPDGKWLCFLSDRTLRSLVSSPWGPRQPEPFFAETTGIFLLGLEKGSRSPFRPPDELAPKSDDPTKDEAKEKEKGEGKPAKDEPVAVRIDLDGLKERLEVVPVSAGNYAELAVTPKHLLWRERTTGFDANSNLRQLAITNDDPKPKTLVEDIRSYELSEDRKKIQVRKGDAFHVIASDASAPAKLDETHVRLEGWMLALDPREEWRQIYSESWRMLRDFFYDRDLHGVNWRAIHEKYLPLVGRVTDRAELSDVIAEMAGELSALHIYVRYGDEREGRDQIESASLGATWKHDPSAGGWRVDHIYRADPDYPDQLSPLARPGVSVSEGDILWRINGRSPLEVGHPDVLLRNQAGRQALIELKTPADPAIRPLIVEPITTGREAELRYDEWEYTRRLRVEQAADGRIGYVHLRAMGAANIAEWARDFYPVFQRQGLILDVRNNRGGNIDSWILGKLLRQAWFYWQPRVGQPYWNMQYAFRGHMVVLCNERTASDGEAFAEGFRRLGLGQVIGTRTWGGEIWLSARRWLVDNGMATAAETGVYGPEGEWLIEGHGVDPDIVVDNLPHGTFQGEDAQLDAAIAHLLDRIAEDPRPVPPTPDYPDKSFP
jgi:tricorn protease